MKFLSSRKCLCFSAAFLFCLTFPIFFATANEDNETPSEFPKRITGTSNQKELQLKFYSPIKLHLDYDALFFQLTYTDSQTAALSMDEPVEEIDLKTFLNYEINSKGFYTSDELWLLGIKYYSYFPIFGDFKIKLSEETPDDDKAENEAELKYSFFKYF